MSDKLAERLRSHTYHRPSTDVQEIMRQTCIAYMEMVKFMDQAVPECREKSLAFTALEESAMWLMKALALTDPDGEVISP